MTTLVAKRTTSPVLKTLNMQVPHQRRAWQSLCEKMKGKKKRKAEVRLFSVASEPWRQSQEAAVRFMKRPDERWRTWDCHGTAHLSWDKQGSVSPSALTLYWPRMLKGWQIVSGRRWREGDGKGLWLFIKESDNKIEHLQGCPRECVALTDHLWQCSSVTVRLQKLHTLWVTGTIKIWHISQSGKRQQEIITVGKQPEDAVSTGSASGREHPANSLQHLTFIKNPQKEDMSRE